MEGPYAYSGNIWVSYDTPGAAADKAQYIVDRNLGGAMFWDLASDDYSVSALYFISTVQS